LSESFKDFFLKDMSTRGNTAEGASDRTAFGDRVANLSTKLFQKPKEPINCRAFWEPISCRELLLNKAVTTYERNLGSCTFIEKLEPINCRALLEPISCPNGKLMIQVTGETVSFEKKWRSRRDNLRNFLLSPSTEMLSFLRQLREAL